VPLPLPGFVESSRLPARTVQCSPPLSCVGASLAGEPNGSVRCAHGYEGLHCGACIKGHYNFYGECWPCGRDADAWGRAALMLVFVLCIALFALELSSRKSTYTGLGLMLNSLQIAGLFNAVFARWPEASSSFFAAAAVVTFRLDSFSPECKLQWLYPVDVYERQVWWLLLPLAFFAVYAVLYVIVRAGRACIGVSGGTVRGRCQGFCGLLRLLALPMPKLNATFISGYARLAISGYPVLVSHALTTMQCTQLEDGTSVMQYSSEHRCYDDRWFAWMWPSVLGLVVYGIGIPVGLYFLIFSSREAAASKLAELKHFQRAVRIEAALKAATADKQDLDPAARTAVHAGERGFGVSGLDAQARARPDFTELHEDDGTGAISEEGGPDGPSRVGSRDAELARLPFSGNGDVGAPAEALNDDGTALAGSGAESKNTSSDGSGAGIGGSGRSAAAGPPTTACGMGIEANLDEDRSGPATTSRSVPAASMDAGDAALADMTDDSLFRTSPRSAVVDGPDAQQAPLVEVHGHASAAAQAALAPGPRRSSGAALGGGAGDSHSAVTCGSTLGHLVDEKFETESVASSKGPEPSSPSDDDGLVQLARWRPSRRQSIGQRIGARLGRIPTDAVMSPGGHRTPGIDEDLDSLVRQRVSAGLDVVTHEELEQWYSKDMIHARLRTSDILVDADHVLWPFIVDYREEAFYWALVEMAEFAAIVLISTFVQDPVSQLSCMLLAILSFMVSVLVVRPYRAEYFNRVELVNDASQILTLIIGISYVREPRPLSGAASDVLIIAIVTANLASLASSVVKDIGDKVDEWRGRSFWGSWRENGSAGGNGGQRQQKTPPAPPPKPALRKPERPFIAVGSRVVSSRGLKIGDAKLSPPDTLPAQGAAVSPTSGPGDLLLSGSLSPRVS